MELLSIKRALLSVTDKSGLDVLATFLHNNGVELVSTGGTQKYLENLKLPVTPVSSVTGFPEILGGRVKTLHPNIYAGILADKDNNEHLDTLNKLELKSFELVCVNLYNFAQAVKDNLALNDAIEQIDIGGPCMLRAAAKNFHSVLVLPAPELYTIAISELLENNMHIPLAFRKDMAARTFATTAAYDNLITSFLN